MEAIATRSLRNRLLEFHFQASRNLQVRPIVKYTSLSFFVDRFMPALQRGNNIDKMQGQNGKSWLLEHLRESNLQLFCFVSIWISSKIHDSNPLSVKSLKALSDKLISDQHFTFHDFSEAELVFMEVSTYVISVPKQRWEFPLLPWVKFATSYDEEQIARVVTYIISHILK
ncbi:hypothetical protein LUZ60_006102 [Juncus effusus]|nr:hypothetical protein LUZ60_006102 [Juncus effusus]